MILAGLGLAVVVALVVVALIGGTAQFFRFASKTKPDARETHD
jgi:hypothetical protein